MRTLLLLSSIILLLSSCATNSLTLRVKEPACVLLPDLDYTAGVIDRSMPTEETAVLDVLDKILTAEGKNLDKEGAAAAIMGLESGLVNTARFLEVRNLNELELRSTAVGTYPAQLTWEQVDRICSENGVNILFSLEMYDTDTKVDLSTAPITLKGPLGLDIPAIEHRVSVTTLVKTGWRIYEPGLRTILDELPVSTSMQFAGKGVNPAAALQQIMQRKDAVKRASNTIGQDYAARVMPYFIRVSREYFVRASRNFRVGKRMARTGNWDGAAEFWNDETDNPKRKIAGRAWYNMAISNEINGDLPKAIEWAAGSYERFNTKRALRYVRVLRNRQGRVALIAD